MGTNAEIRDCGEGAYTWTPCNAHTAGSGAWGQGSVHAWFTMMCAWLACWRPRIVSPPRPMMRPTIPAGQGTNWVDSPLPMTGSTFIRLLISVTALFTESGVGPVIVTDFVSPTVLWSICAHSERRSASCLVTMGKAVTRQSRAMTPPLPYTN